MENVSVPLPELIEVVKTRLRKLQYRPTTIDGFSSYWKKLLEYAEERQAEFFTVALGEDFLREKCHIDVTAEEEAPGLPRWKVNPPKRAVYMLADFQNSGSILRKGTLTILKPSCLNQTDTLAPDDAISLFLVSYTILALVFRNWLI